MLFRLLGEAWELGFLYTIVLIAAFFIAIMFAIIPHEIAHGSLRISLSEENTEDDIDYILEKLPPIAEKLRAMSPLWERLIQSEPVVVNA